MTLRDYLEAAAVAFLAIQGVIILMTLDQLKQEVAQTVTEEASAKALIAGLAVQLAAFKNEPDQIQALADSLVNGREDLASAVVANTPSAPSPEPTPEPTPAVDPAPEV